MSISDDARELIFGLVDKFAVDPAALESALVRGAELPPEVRADMEAVLSDGRISYRDGVMIQLSYGVVSPELDLTRRAAGARSVAQHLGSFLAERHIRYVKDAYQNIAKNTDVLTRGNVAEFDRLLGWATGAGPDQRMIALSVSCARVAATTRPVRPMPPLDRGRLTFARVGELLIELLDTPSGGAFEQFTVAALLDTLVADNAPSHRVETKNLNASDRSSHAAGDVQIMTGSRVIDAFEVTANSWRVKLAGAGKTIRDNDLSRLHIIAARPDGEREEVTAALGRLGDDVSVLDVRQATEVLLAVLTRPQRAEALRRLYEYLDRYQPDVDRVNLYVERLAAADLVERGGE